VGRQADPHAIRIGQRTDVPARLLDESDRIRRIETNQLVEDDGRERAADEQLERHERVADVADHCGPAAHGLVDAFPGGLDEMRCVWIRIATSRGHDRADPGHEIRGWRHVLVEMRQFEVRVSVDEPRQDRDATRIVRIR